MSGEILVHRPIEAPLAREILRAMPEEHARRSNLYVDDQLYVWEENEATVRYSQVAGVPMHVVGNTADWIERPTTKIVTVGTNETMDALRDQMQPLFGSRRSSRNRCPTSSSSRRPACRRRAACSSSPTGSASRPPRPWPSAMPRTTARCSSGRTVGLAVANADERLIGEADAVIPSVHDDGVAQLLEALAAARSATG